MNVNVYWPPGTQPSTSMSPMTSPAFPQMLYNGFEMSVYHSHSFDQRFNNLRPFNSSDSNQSSLKTHSSPESDASTQRKAKKGGARRYKTPSPQLLRCRREAANARERRRMNHLNDAFEELRKVLPPLEQGRRLSKFETLQMAQAYIEQLAYLLQQP
ncbi:unnamed protein product [Bursaphelenchus xylophilus]|uniref:(pine wood nematode) hypothetical protein n=1 Tax=Bursaphelenchus xylophilus TaxID=6326 RepID=A0A1I7SMV4_BURXY|nr:unnamed protein product [Bursaphelenchus xylophilus]CAG9130403.1 unnamed protein product [Bursaphelenchus xylophilus]